MSISSKPVTGWPQFWLAVGTVALLSGCASKQVNQNLPVAREDQVWIERQRLPKQLPVPVKGVSREQLRDTWGAARSGGRCC